MTNIFCNRCRAILIGIAIAASSSSVATATVIDSQVFPSNGHTYKLLAASSWHAAQSEAQGLGGDLVTVNDAAENNFIYTTFGPKALSTAPMTGKVNLWLGTTDMDVEDTWKWISGLSSSFTDWFAGQPQDTYGDEDFGGIRVRGSNSRVPVGHWIDIVADSRLGDLSFGVVEIGSGTSDNPAVPEPCAFVLIAIGSLVTISQRYWNRHTPRIPHDAGAN